jgi:hypothetical protein
MRTLPGSQRGLAWLPAREPAAGPGFRAWLRPP